jgi:hypothetical protein
MILFDLIAPAMNGQAYRWWRSILQAFLPSPVTSNLLSVRLHVGCVNQITHFFPTFSISRFGSNKKPSEVDFGDLWWVKHKTLHNFILWRKQQKLVKLFLGQKPNQSIFPTHVSVGRWPLLLAKHRILDCVWNVMAQAQKPDFVFRRKWRVNLNRQGRQFSRLLAGELCTSACRVCAARASLCSAVTWRLLATHSIRQFPLHFPSSASPCAITFQLDSKIFWSMTNTRRPQSSINECSRLVTQISRKCGVPALALAMAPLPRSEH